MIKHLEKNGYIKSIGTSSNITFYAITEMGMDASYLNGLRIFFIFARSANEMKDEEQLGEGKRGWGK